MFFIERLILYHLKLPLVCKHTLYKTAISVQSNLNPELFMKMQANQLGDLLFKTTFGLWIKGSSGSSLVGP